MKPKAKKRLVKTTKPKPAPVAVKSYKSKFDGKTFTVVSELAEHVHKDSKMGVFLARAISLGTFGRNDVCPPAECRDSKERMTQTGWFEQAFRKGIIVQAKKKEARNA